MIRLPATYNPDAPVIVMDIGNTSVHLATWESGEVKTPLVVPSNDFSAFDEAFQAHRSSLPQSFGAVTVISSVAPPVLLQLADRIHKTTQQPPLVVGDDIPLPMELAIKDKRAVGVDRICAAAAAYDKIRTGCVVIDFGTAVTIDLIDDEGAFQGGAILPGLQMQFRALHEFTAQLPVVTQGLPDLPYGRNTVEAIQTGVCRGLAGAVRGIVEGYATWLNRWPQTLATGGDVAFMAPHCEFVDTLVADLTLRGVGLAYTKHLAEMGA